MCPDQAGPVAGVVLAAGSSLRMGRNKLLLELEGETVLHRVVSRAIAGGLDSVVVVLGVEADAARRELSDLEIRIVVNLESKRGMNHSIELGIDAVPDAACAAVVLLADMPFVTSEMIEVLVSRYRSGSARLIVSRYGRVTAPPVLHDRSLFSECIGPDGDGLGREILHQYRDEAVFVDWPESVLSDIDVPGDYERVRAQLASG